MDTDVIYYSKLIPWLEIFNVYLQILQVNRKPIRGDDYVVSLKPEDAE